MVDAPVPKPRWYHLTPDRAVLGLLAVEGFLLLSEWCQWFAFNRHKGHTVLIAGAVVGVVFLLMLFWFLAALLFRLRFQFSIRSLLVLAGVVAIPFSWLATEMKGARKQREAVEATEKAGGSVYYDYEFDPSDDWIPGATPPGPPWLRKLLGGDLYADVTRVSFVNSDEVRAADLKHLEGLPQIHMVWLSATTVGDDGLAHLKGLTQLRELFLWDTKVTDAGLEHLARLSQLEGLYLGDTKVTDVGLQHLEGLTRLQKLYIGRTKVSDAGLRHLKGLTQLRELDLGCTSVGDAGIQHLKGLTRLQLLDLSGTKISDAGVSDLQEALPKARIIIRRYTN
ncbi:MAG: hypothetical protein ACLQLG_20350 [Thermoguttaceae bacterium]